MDMTRFKPNRLCWLRLVFASTLLACGAQSSASVLEVLQDSLNRAMGEPLCSYFPADMDGRSKTGQHCQRASRDGFLESWADSTTGVPYRLLRGWRVEVGKYDSLLFATGEVIGARFGSRAYDCTLSDLSDLQVWIKGGEHAELIGNRTSGVLMLTVRQGTPTVKKDACSLLRGPTE